MDAPVKKKFVLAYPPFSVVTSAPLGVCSLKGYIEKQLPEWSVKVIDLNLLTFEAIHRALKEGLELNRQVFPEGPIAEISLQRAMDVFRGGDQSEFYSRAQHYSTYATLFNRLFESELQGSLGLEATCVARAKLPPLIEQQADMIISENPDRVGISICYSHQFWMGVALALAIRKRRKIPIIFGGTFFFGRITEKFLRDFPDLVDLVISGEGERGLIAYLNEPDNYSMIPGAAYLKNGVFQVNDNEYASNLDDFSVPDYSDLELRRYYSPEPVAPILASRGCYWRRCAFCTHYRSSGLTYRKRSVGQVINELKDHVAKGINHFAFIDEMISPPHFEELAKAIIEAGLKIHYYALAKPVAEFSKERLSLMRKSGLEYVLWGVESGCQRVLDLINKGTRVESMATVLEDAHSVGIRNHVYVIVGFPTETREELKMTLDFLEAHKAAISYIHRGTFVLGENSKVYDSPGDYSITKIWKKSDQYLQASHGYTCSCGMSEEEAKDAFVKVLPYFRAFNPYSFQLGNFRDHALLIYSRLGSSLDMGKRPIPGLNDIW